MNNATYSTQGQLTVMELIKLLKAQPQDAMVWCDSPEGYGPAERVWLLDAAKLDERGWVIIGSLDE